MKKIRLIPRLSLIILTTFIVFLTGYTTKVNAVTLNDVNAAADLFAQYDGIKWTKQNSTPPNQIGYIPLTSKVKLGYTFGAARNANETVVAGDTTITKNSGTGSEGDAPTITNSKMNVFIDNNDSYYGVIHQGPNSYIGGGGSPENASNTSIDYALLTGEGSSNYYSAMNLLTNSSLLDSSTGSYKLFYTGQYSGQLALRLVGYYSKNGGLFYELVLRASPTGLPIVQRELYVYNPNRGSTQFQTFFGEDTGLTGTNLSSPIDNVPMYAIGGGKGLYIESGLGKNDTASKLYITNDLDGGFKDFMGRVLTNPTNWSVKGKQGAGNAPDITDPKLPWDSTTLNGDTNDAAGQNLLQINKGGTIYNIVDSHTNQDTAYTLRWPMTTLAGGSVSHYSSNIGAVLAGIAVPYLKGSVKNSSTGLDATTNTNKIGDKLHFTYTLTNQGYQSKWVIDRILDSLPKGLTLDRSSTVYASTNNTIDANPNTSVSDGDAGAMLTFDATINSEAAATSGSSVTNTATFTGHTAGQSDSSSKSVSLKIPVAATKFVPHFVNQLKNESDPNSDFSSTVTAHKDDIIDYQATFTSTGTDALKTSYFYDVVPDGLDIVPNTLKLNGVSALNSESGRYLGFNTGALNNNVNNKISFKLKVTSLTPLTVANPVQLTHVTTTSGSSDTIDSEDPQATVDIQGAPLATSFTEVPSKIDFGVVNNAGLEKLLPNKSTTGKLRLVHSADTPFGVSVSYDNNSDNSVASNGNKLVQDGGNTLFFEQADTNTWQPLSTTETPIKTDGFSGSYTDLDLTQYIGSNKWKIRVPASTKPGQYNGQITWSIADTPQ